MLCYLAFIFSSENQEIYCVLTDCLVAFTIFAFVCLPVCLLAPASRQATFRHVANRKYDTHCNTLQHTATHCNTLQHTATHVSPSALRQTTICNITLWITATRCHTLQHTATHCNALQHTATHCNIRVFQRLEIDDVSVPHISFLECFVYLVYEDVDTGRSIHR